MTRARAHHTRLFTYATSALAALAAACGHAETATSTTTTTAATAKAPGSASADRVAAARCDREEACGNVGSGRTYATREACVEQLQGEATDDVAGNACPNGVDERALDKCLAAVQGERCANALDRVSRLNACRAEDLCAK